MCIWRIIKQWELFVPMIWVIILGCTQEGKSLPNNPVECAIKEDYSDGKLRAKVVYTGKIYNNSNWPYGTPYFTWYKIQPVVKNDVVCYEKSTIEYGAGKHECNWENIIGIRRYRFEVSNVDGKSGSSHRGVKAFKIIRGGGFDNNIVNTASSYIRVPFVLGREKDVHGEEISKGEFRGYGGLDCSGLAGWAYLRNGIDINPSYSTDLQKIDNTNAQMLYDSFKVANAKYGEWQSGDMIFVDAYPESNPDGVVDHVGIIRIVGTNPNKNEDEVFHATKRTDPQSGYHNISRSVMREQLKHRTYWESRFKGLGRKKTTALAMCSPEPVLSNPEATIIHMPSIPIESLMITPKRVVCCKFGSRLGEIGYEDVEEDIDNSASSFFGQCALLQNFNPLPYTLSAAQMLTFHEVL